MVFWWNYKQLDKWEKSGDRWINLTEACDWETEKSRKFLLILFILPYILLSSFSFPYLFHFIYNIMKVKVFIKFVEFWERWKTIGLNSYRLWVWLFQLLETGLSGSPLAEKSSMVKNGEKCLQLWTKGPHTGLRYVKLRRWLHQGWEIFHEEEQVWGFLWKLKFFPMSFLPLEVNMESACMHLRDSTYVC